MIKVVYLHKYWSVVGDGGSGGTLWGSLSHEQMRSLSERDEFCCLRRVDRCPNTLSIRPLHPSKPTLKFRCIYSHHVSIVPPTSTLSRSLNASFISHPFETHCVLDHGRPLYTAQLEHSHGPSLLSCRNFTFVFHTFTIAAEVNLHYWNGCACWDFPGGYHS